MAEKPCTGWGNMAACAAAAWGKQYPDEVWQHIKGSRFSCFSDYIARRNYFCKVRPSQNLSMEHSPCQSLAVEPLPTSAQCGAVAVPAACWIPHQQLRGGARCRTHETCPEQEECLPFQPPL